jgi:hypothetical protein
MESKQFAWFPVRVTSKKLIWLKYYLRHKDPYDLSTGRPPLSAQYFMWTETAEEKTWRLLKEGAVQNRNIWNQYNYTKEDKL